MSGSLLGFSTIAACHSFDRARYVVGGIDDFVLPTYSVEIDRLSIPLLVGFPGHLSGRNGSGHR
jgi:hypothetical protein